MGGAGYVPSELADRWRYTLQRRAGAGGTSEVWRAQDVETGEQVALKVASRGADAERVADEAEALLGTVSPSIPRLLGLGRVPEGIAGLQAASLYIVLSWAEGTALEPRRQATRKQRVEAGLAIARDIGDGLWRLHEAGVAHGDIKPANIMLDARKGVRASLVDLGFSRRIDGTALRGATPRYLAPESLGGNATAVGLDLWALGVVLAEAVSEDVASSEEPRETMQQVQLPAPFEMWCKALTAREPGARPTAAWLARAARDWLGERGWPDEAWRVHACYLRVRRDVLRDAATCERVQVHDAVEPGFHDAVGLSRAVAKLRGASTAPGTQMRVEPMDPAERARWLVALVGSAAASWRLDKALVDRSEHDLGTAMRRLASVLPPRAWSLHDLVGALQTGIEAAPELDGMAALDEVELALALSRHPVSPLALAEGERRSQRGKLGDRLTLLLADTLRAGGETGRALAALGQRQDPASRALRSEILRRAGDREAAEAEALRVGESDAAALQRARSVLARLRLDAGDARGALAIVSDGRSASACEVRALARLALGERDAALQDVELGLALALDDETRARLECVRGMHAHAAGDAETAQRAFSRAVEHASRAGALIEEATYRTGEASAAVMAGLVQEALEASTRAALLWEHMGRKTQWAYALLARAGGQNLAGAWLQARQAAQAAVELGRETHDARVELYAWMVLCDAHEPRSEEARHAAREAYAIALGRADEEDTLRAAARLLGCGGLEEERIRALDQVAHGAGAAGQCDWWGARAASIRTGAANGRAPEVIAQLARLARQRAPVESKGPAIHEARLLAEHCGDGEAARLFAAEQSRLAMKLVVTVPAELRDSVAAVPWIRARQLRAEPSVSVDQVRNLEGLVRALAHRDNLRGLLEQVLDALVLWTGVERGMLLLRAPDNRLVVRAARNLERGDLRADQQALSQSLALRALETREPVVAVDAAGEISEVHASVHALGLRSVLAVPLLARGEALGVAYLDDRIRAGAFGPQELAWVKLIALVAAVAIADARDQLQLRRAARRAERAQRSLADSLAHREAELDRTSAELARAREGGDTRYRYDALIGRSEPMRAMLQLVDRVTPTAVPVLIVGESGSGKELVARALHQNGPRSRGPFVSENCSAIPESLLESTLFGHVKGAFTSADRNRIGLFEAAHGGTLLLDEIGEMSPGMQSKLLRALQDGEVHPVGSTRSRKVDVRVIAATHRELAQLVQEGRFREDLLYRLNVIPIRVPSLRERRDDVELLARHFIGRYGEGRKVRVSHEAMARLTGYDWPGNVRQLENEIRRALVLCDEVIRTEHLSPEVGVRSGRTRAAGLELRARVDELEKQLVVEALGRTRGNQTQAAQLLGLSRFGLQKMIRRLGVEEA
jgi:serine/threonine-protein kinase PknK